MSITTSQKSRVSVLGVREDSDAGIIAAGKVKFGLADSALRSFEDFAAFG